MVPPGQGRVIQHLASEPQAESHSIALDRWGDPPHAKRTHHWITGQTNVQAQQE